MSNFRQEATEDTIQSFREITCTIDHFPGELKKKHKITGPQAGSLRLLLPNGPVRLNRRDFLRICVSAGTAVAASQILPGCGDKNPTKPQAANTQTSRIACIRGTDLYEMARQVLEAVGGIEAFVNPGETVFIKPNFMAVGMFENPFATGWSTKPEILIAVAEECLKAGASEVIIGDGAQVRSWSWQNLTTLDGSTNLAEAAQNLSLAYGKPVRLACLEVDTPEWVEIDSSVEIEPGRKKIAVSSFFYHADRVISVPVLRTHPWTQLTLSMKNLLGVTPLGRYGSFIMRNKLHEAYANSGGIEQCFIDILKVRKPDLAILDASIGVEGLMYTVNMKDRLGDWFLLAGADLVALDATAARIVNHDVEDVKQLGMASEQGLGRVLEEHIDVIGESLDEMRMAWLRAPHVEEWGAAPGDEIASSGPESHRRSAIINHLIPFFLPMGTCLFLKHTHREDGVRMVVDSEG